MLNRINEREREHLARVKEQPCACCNAAGPSEAHHIEQGMQYTCIPLCPDCHRGAIMGIHGQRRAWALRKMTEMEALNITLERLFNELS